MSLGTNELLRSSNEARATTTTTTTIMANGSNPPLPPEEPPELIPTTRDERGPTGSWASYLHDPSGTPAPTTANPYPPIDLCNEEYISSLKHAIASEAIQTAKWALDRRRQSSGWREAEFVAEVGGIVRDPARKAEILRRAIATLYAEMEREREQGGGGEVFVIGNGI